MHNIKYISLAHRTTESSLKYYVFSLALTDILVGAISIPLYLLILLRQYTSHTYDDLRNVYTCLDIFWCACSIFHLCLMAADRAIAVTKPFFRQRIMQGSTAFKLLCIPWLSALATAVMYFFWKEVSYFFLILSVISFIIPALTIAGCYTAIYIEVRRRNNTQHEHRINERRLIRTILCVVIVFLTCWTPFHVMHILIGSKKVALTSATSEWLFGVAKWLQYANSACNPFIYAIFHPVFRSAIVDTLSGCFRKQKNRVSNNDDGIGSNELPNTQSTHL